jgi:hypothetical protein
MKSEKRSDTQRNGIGSDIELLDRLHASHVSHGRLIVSSRKALGEKKTDVYLSI